MSAARQPPALDPEAEYEEAKEQYGRVMVRLRAAKAAMKAIEDAREAARKQEQQAMLIDAARLFVDGAPYKAVAAAAGKGPSYTDFRYLFSPFWRQWLSHEEIWSEVRNDSVTNYRTWERLTTERALDRYRRGTKR